MMAIAARFYGTCGECDGTIKPGDLIITDPLDGASATWIHERCPESLEHRREVCPTCFIEKPCACDDDELR